METTRSERDGLRADRGGDADRLHPQQSSDADAGPADADGAPESVAGPFHGYPCRACPISYSFDPVSGPLSYEQFAYGFALGPQLGYADHCDRFADCYGNYRRFTESNPDESRRQP